jgi:hypothetical protein
MAENEILDLGGRRWTHTRAALAKPDLSLSAMAACAADNLQSVLQSSLANAFRNGQTLLSIFHAVDQHPAAMRAAVSMFQDQQLARIARDATVVASIKDSASISQCAADMLIDGLISKTMVIANGNGCFQDSGRLKALRSALEQEFSGRRINLSSVIEASLQGQATRRFKSVRRNQAPVTAGSLVLAPLAIRKGGSSHVHQPY